MTLKNYLTETERKYAFRIKTVVELNDEQLDLIEAAIVKYLPFEMSSVRKTIFQKAPLDFPEISGAEVYMVDLVLGLPVSTFVLKEELRAVLRLPHTHIAVRGENDPTELETNRLNDLEDMSSEAKDKGFIKDALLNHSDYPEAVDIDASNHFGNDYNSKLLDYLKRVQDTRKVQNVDAPNSLFSWANMPKVQHPDPNEFNAHIDGAPKVATKGSEEYQADVGNNNNYDDEGLTRKRVYVNDKGDRVVLSRKNDRIRKEID